MNNLLCWDGKVDDITISYDAGFSQNNQYLIGTLGESLFPAIIYPESDNLRDVTEVIWDETINKADRIDYLLAFGCGSIVGLIDVFYVGEFSLERANAWGREETNKFVKKVAELNGFKGDTLSDAISFMEKKYGFAADKKTADFGGGLQHHLRDFSHHFSLGGLLCSLFTQFTGKIIGTDVNGAIKIVDVQDKTFIGRNLEEKLFFGIVNWFFHMVSDMAGSSAAAGGGAGIPGPLLSLIKELSSLPCFKDRKIRELELHIWVSKLFNGTLLAKRDKDGKITEAVKFDLRTEIGILHEAGRQIVPVIINECLVRGVYFLRRLCIALKSIETRSFVDLQNIKITDLLPFNNRIITRMVTVASGTFVAVDTVDAAVRSFIKNRGINPKFFVDFAVRINVAGVARFIVACKLDGHFITEDIQEAKEKRDRIQKEYAKAISELKSFTLTYDQLTALYSIERLMVQDDIAITRNEEKKIFKTAWKESWEKQIRKTMQTMQESESDIFMQESEVLGYIERQEPGSWLYLIALEALMFKPYYPIDCDDIDKELKKLDFKSKYLTQVFLDKQSTITKKDLSLLKKAHEKSVAAITGSTKKVIAGTVGTTAAAILTSGLAYAYAPAIAVAVAGESATGLSGAALVSYSLAFVGGGAIAAGGLGMAGGTAIIVGGGALVGLLGGASIGGAGIIVDFLTKEGYILSETCKLLTFAKAVLYEKYSDFITVEAINLQIAEGISTFQNIIQDLESGADTRGKEEIKEAKVRLKIAYKNLNYLKRCEKELNQLRKGNHINARTVVV